MQITQYICHENAYIYTDQTLNINEVRNQQKQHEMLQYMKSSNLCEKYSSFLEYHKPAINGQELPILKLLMRCSLAAEITINLLTLKLHQAAKKCRITRNSALLSRSLQCARQ